MSKQTTEKIPIAPTLRALGINEQTAFPLRRIATVKNICSLLALSDGLQLRTHVNRDSGCIEVTRLQ